MNGFARTSIWLAILFAPALLGLGNELDESSGIYSVVPRSLKWENVRSPSQWVAGNPIATSRKDKLAFLVLKPGDTTTVRVPRQELVRVLPLDGQLTHQQVEVWSSDGSGLYRRLPLHVNHSDGSLVAAPNQPNASLAFIRRPMSQNGCGRLAVFVSRHDEAPVVDEYKAMLCQGKSDPVQIRRRCEQAAKRFWRVDANQPVTATVAGPTRLRFDTRFRFNETESQSRQTYQLSVTGADDSERILEFASSSDLRQISVVDGATEVLGSKAVNYLDIGPGSHRLTFHSIAPIYLRVDAKKCVYRYRINDVSMNRLANVGPIGSTELAPSIWQTPLDRLLNESSTLLNSVALEQAAWISGRDNRFREGGLKAYMLMRAASAGRSHQPEVRNLAERVRLQRTFFRNVLPSSQPFPVQPRLGVFSTDRLRDRDEELPNVVLKETLIDDALAQLGRGYFVATPTMASAPSVYAIPQNLGASVLRVAVDRQTLCEPTRFAIRFDDRQPIEMVAFPHEPRCMEEYAPTRASSSLVAQQWQHAQGGPATLGGAYAREYEPAPLVSAATNELILPSGVRRVSVWAHDDQQAPPQIAVQYRASRPHLLTETNFESHAMSCGDALMNALNGHSINPELANMYVPLQRLLQTHRRAFESSVVNRVRREPELFFSAEETQALVEQAEQFVAGEKYAAAIEAWTELANHTRAEHRAAALLKRIEALRAAGEHFLADREARGLFLFDADPGIRQLAYESLLRQTRDDGESFGAEQLIATKLLRDPSAGVTNDLAEILVANGRFDLAMHCLLTLRNDSRRHDLMVRAAFAQRWWSTFEQALPYLPEAEQASWRGKRFLFQGKTDEAMAAFAIAGEEGQRLTQLCMSGAEVLESLKSANASERAAAIHDWGKLQASHPGPFKWNEEQGIVYRSPGYRAVYHKSRDVYSHYYLTRANDRAVLRVFGPVKLKVETRPVHETMNGDPIDGWVRVNVGDRELVYPIANDFPSSELILVDNERCAPGRLVNVELDLGPGMHELTLHSNEADLVLRAFAERPETPLPILPPINEETFIAAMSGQYGAPAFQAESPHRLLMFEANRLQSLPLTSAAPNFQRTCELEECLARASVQPRKPNEHVRPREDEVLQEMLHLVEDVEQDKSQLIRQILDAQGLVEQNPDRTDLRKHLATLMKATTWQQYKQFDSSAGVHSQSVSRWQPDSPQLRIRRTLFDEDFDARYAIAGTNSLVIDLQNKHARNLSLSLKYPAISYLHHWPLTALLQSGDMPPQRIELSPGSEQSIPVTLPPGQHQLRLSLEEHIPNHFVLVKLADLLVSTAADAKILRFPNSNGRDIELLPPPAAELDALIEPSLSRPAERFYQVATRLEPVQFRAQGPAVFRVDELLDGQTETRRISVDDKQQTITLSPRGERSKAFFRVFELVAKSESDPPPSKQVPKPAKPVPDPLLACIDRVFDSQQEGIRLSLLERFQRNDPSSMAFALGLENADSDASTIDGRDAAPLDAQLDRTWGYSLGAFQRRPVEESQDVSVPGRFLQADIARYAYDPWRDRYDETHAFVRMRNASGPTLGLTHEVRREIQDVPAIFPRWSQCECEPHPLNVFWKAASYFQFLDPTGGGDSVLWSGRLEGGLSRRYEINECWHHTPSVGGFLRPLSLRSSRAYQAGDVDQDLFTPYKAEHRWGLRFSDKITFRQAADSECWIRPSLTMNENLVTPDNLGLQAGTTQMWGSIDFNASYRVTAYFHDDDRSRTTFQHVLYLDAVFERWQSRNVRHELGLSIRHDIGNGGSTGNLVWTVFANDRRGYRDIHPRHIRFLSVKRQRAFRRGLLD